MYRSTHPRPAGQDHLLTTLPGNFFLGALLVATLLLGTLLSPQASAETVYISDELTVPLRSGPSGGHRILHRGLPSGTALEVLSVDEEAQFTQIRTQRGTEGWIRTQYLVSEPIAKIRLAGAEQRLARLRSELQEKNDTIAELTSTTRDQASANSRSSEEINGLKTELERIQRLSATALETHAENERLKEINARLLDELDDVSEARDRLQDNATNQGIMLGAGFIFVGLIAGVLIKSRPQRSAWS